MSDLDQFIISRALGSTFQPYARKGFGGFSAAPALGEMLASRPKPLVRLQRDDTRDAKIVKAFARVHRGYSADRLLADPDLDKAFIDACRDLGINEPPAAVNRRLLRIRKATDLPNRLPRTSVEDPRDLRPFLITAELAFAQIGYRYEASYDDLISDPEIGAAFDALARRMGHEGSAVDYRLAALHLRKNIRSRSRAEQRELADLGVEDLIKRWEAVGPVAKVPIEDLPDNDGIFALSEPGRYLYLTRYPDLREGVERFRDPDVLSALKNRFWEPSLKNISLEIILPVRNDLSLRLLELKALEVHRPIFNLLPKAA